jgi:hypothetical protein
MRLYYANCGKKSELGGELNRQCNGSRDNHATKASLLKDQTQSLCSNNDMRLFSIETGRVFIDQTPKITREH